MRGGLAFVLLTFIGLSSQAQDFQWAKNLGEFAYIREIKEGASGHIIVAGEFESLEFGRTRYESEEGFGIFIATFDHLGNEQSIQILRNEGDLELFALDTDAAGNIFLLGHSTDPLTFQDQSI
ncbi:MAG: hypothetical protein AAFU64_19950, partial [Bacteroidota bacterium]